MRNYSYYSIKDLLRYFLQCCAWCYVVIMHTLIWINFWLYVKVTWVTWQCITACAIAPSCCISDVPSQWESQNFDPPQSHIFQPILIKTQNQERYPGYDPACKIWLMWDDGKGVCQNGEYDMIQRLSDVYVLLDNCGNPGRERLRSAVPGLGDPTGDHWGRTGWQCVHPTHCKRRRQSWQRSVQQFILYLHCS